MPCSRYGGATGAVPSGRSVSDRPPASSNVYISFWTMSVDSPTPRANRSGASKPGRSVRRERGGRREARGLDARVAGRLEDPLRGRLDRAARWPLGRQHVERAALGLDALAHRAISARKGFVSRSLPRVVVPMWPGRTSVSSG